MLSLLFGSPVFAGPPEGKGKGADTSHAALTNHAGGHSQGIEHADDNAAFMSVSTDDTSGDTSGDDSGDTTSCPEGTLDMNGDGSLCL